MYIPLFKITFCQKMPSSELSASHDHFVGRGLHFNVDDSWLIRVVDAEGWSGCENFLKIRQWRICNTDSSFTNDFSVACRSDW